MSNYDRKFREQQKQTSQEPATRARKPRQPKAEPPAVELVELVEDNGAAAQENEAGFNVFEEDVANWESWQEFGDGDNELTISICRAPNASHGKERFCLRFTSSTYTPQEIPEVIQRECGGGDYRLRGYIRGRCVFNKPVSVEERKTVSTDVRAPGGDPFDARTMQLQFMDMQIASQKQMLELMSSLATSLRPAQPAAPAFDPMQTMQMMFTMLTGAREMFKPADGGGAFEMFEKGMALAEKFASRGGDGESGTNDVLVSLMQTVAPALKAMAENAGRPVLPNPAQRAQLPAPKQQQPAQQKPAPALAAVPTVASARQAAALQMRQARIEALKATIPPQVAELAPMISHALAGSDSVSDTAQLILDATVPLSDEEFEVLADFVFENDVVEKICALLPELTARRVFIGDVVELLRQVWEDEEEDEIPDGEGNKIDGILTPDSKAAINSPGETGEPGQNDGANVLSSAG